MNRYLFDSIVKSGVITKRNYISIQSVKIPTTLNQCNHSLNINNSNNLPSLSLNSKSFNINNKITYYCTPNNNNKINNRSFCTTSTTTSTTSNNHNINAQVDSNAVKDPKQIIADLQREYLDKDPTNFDALTYKCMLELQTRQPQNALDSAKRAVESLKLPKTLATFPNDLEFRRNEQKAKIFLAQSYSALELHRDASDVYNDILISADKHKSSSGDTPTLSRDILRRVYIAFFQENNLYRSKSYDILQRIEREFPQEPLEMADELCMGIILFEREAMKESLHRINKGLSYLQFDGSKQLNFKRYFTEKQKKYPNLPLYPMTVERVVLRNALIIKNILLSKLGDKSQETINERLDSLQTIFDVSDKYTDPNIWLVYQSIASLNRISNNHKLQLENAKFALYYLDKDQLNSQVNFKQRMEILTNIIHGMSFLKVDKKEVEPFINDSISFIRKLANGNDKEKAYLDSTLENINFLSWSIQYYQSILKFDYKQWNHFISTLSNSDRKLVTNTINTRASLDEISEYANRWIELLTTYQNNNSNDSEYFNTLKKSLEIVKLTTSKEMRKTNEKLNGQISYQTLFALIESFNGSKVKPFFENTNQNILPLVDIKWIASDSPTNTSEMVQAFSNFQFSKAEKNPEVETRIQEMYQAGKSLAYALALKANKLSIIPGTERMTDIEILEDGEKLNKFDSKLERQLFLTYKAFIQAHQGDKDTAIEWFKSIIQDDPTCVFAKMKLGYVYLLSNRFDEAEAIFKDIVAMDPSIVNDKNATIGAMTYIGYCKYFSGQYDLALEQFQSIYDKGLISKDNLHPVNYYIRVGSIQSTLHLIVDQIKQWQHIVELQPMLNLLSGLNNFALGNDREAVHYLSKLERFDSPNNIFSFTKKIPNWDSGQSQSIISMVNLIWDLYKSILPKLEQGITKIDYHPESIIFASYLNFTTICLYLREDARARHFYQLALQYQ